MPQNDMDDEDQGRPFRCEPKFYMYREEIELEVHTGLSWTIQEAKWEAKEIKMEMTEVIVAEFKEPELTPYEQALEGTYKYFVSIGCEGLRRGRGNTPVIRLPNGVDEWSIDLDGDLLVVEKVSPGTAMTARVAKTFKVPLADPESFPKVLAHLQKHTKFLRGGVNSSRFVPKAD